ncbi:ATP-binding protein [Saccharopolyspora mangrovi]|uniref:ATP-binding protein n=1 Tax=Saccharopolyspora mangrovi TaxID=3082379 RepID=A0ABU6A3A7_9PSEU|nr:ATP-binding protein [Saccharopolyspora sp. S2-29]MEB3365895.1 ATP-binding protein [Saccharopolyspora sp. S2-29]
MAAEFIGRRAELAMLRKRLDRVAESGSGSAITIRGRRQVGKSRLVQELCDASGLPYAYYTAIKGASLPEATGLFLAELKSSGLPADREAIPETVSGWPDALRALASALPETPSIVVLDELPWLAEQDEAFDGVLQAMWDRLISRKPVLLLLLGSDIHMMERLTSYDRPFYGRADNFVLPPLNVAETGQALQLEPAEAIDAHLITGGLPGILRSWPRSTPPTEFVKAECADPATPLFGIPESTLLAEFPSPDHARRVLEAVGSGDRTHAAIAATAGGIPSGTLSPLLQRLINEKHVLAQEQPLSTSPGKPALYRVADSNLRLYLAVLRSAHDLVLRGRTDAAFRIFERRWASWRVRAAEPLIRETLGLAATSGMLPWPDVEAVGGWWNRQFDPEIDLIGADREPVAQRIHFAGSIKWLESSFDQHDWASLQRAVSALPGWDPTRGELIVVSRSGLAPQLDGSGIGLAWGPEEIVETWRSG